MRFLMYGCLLGVLLLAPACFGGVLDDQVALHQVQKRLSEAVSLYWQSRDVLENAQAHDPEAEKAFAKLEAKLKKVNAWFGGEIRAALVPLNWDRFLLLSRAYGSVDPNARPAFQEARDLGATAYLQVPLPEEAGDFKEYFPGYGYAEPGYRYRRGKELGRDYKGDFWQYEEHTYQKETTHSIMVSLDVLAILKSLLGQGLITNLQISGPQEIPVNGAFVVAYEATFTTKESMTTKAQRQYEIYRVWFELFRTKKDIWNPETAWELCGKNYQIMYEPTGSIFMPDWPLPEDEDDDTE